jgi:acyl-CoA synthetase (AMP-forming)/AMP-acid ligase II
MDAAQPFQGLSSVADLLERRARAQPDRLAYCYLARGETEAERLSNDELLRLSGRVASLLTSRGARDERALLLYPPGLAFATAFFGALRARTLAAPMFPPDPRAPARSLTRLRAAARDCGARFVLTTGALLEARATLVEAAPELADLEWLATDALSDAGAAFDAPPIDASSIAFLQYTSGSTAAPRGVMVTHANLLDNCARIKHAFRQDENCLVVTWLPMYHDMGLIGCLLEPLYSGFASYLMAPLDFLKHPVRWLAAISRYRATISGAPNFAYDLCAREISAAQSAGLDLSSWRVAYCGAEPVHAETLQRFAQRFAPHGFRIESFHPCYGLAEATLLVTGEPKAAAPRVGCFDDAALARNLVRPARSGHAARTLVSCGRADSGQELIVVDPKRRVVVAGDRVGEVWIKGPSVARGYYGRAEMTREVFLAETVDGQGPYLRTGDLGFVQEGELFICGRIKDLIVVAGKNHYPQDIERTVHASVPDLRVGGVAAFSVEKESQEQVIVVVELGARQWRDSAWQRKAVGTIREAVSREHQLVLHDVVLARPRTIPRTSSGKLERLSCRSKYLSRSIAAAS